MNTTTPTLDRVTTPHPVRFILVVMLGIAAALALASCGEGTAPTAPTPPSNTANQNGCGNVQGNGNTVNCAPATPTPTPSTGTACIPQVGPFTCGKATAQFQAIIESVQAKVADAPEVIYVANLVKALNDHVGADGKPDICAVAGFPLPTDEVAIKPRISNAVSETWDVVNANGSPQALYTATCNPARF